MNAQRAMFGSHSDTSVILLKNMVTELFGQMRDPGDPAASSPRSSTGSLANGAVTKNIGFLPHNSSEHLPWSTPAVPLAGSCNSNLVSDGHGALVKSLSNASALTSLCVDLSPSDSHFFEVLYIGKVRISQRKVPDTLIDDALQKFAVHEAEKALKRRHSLLSSTQTSLWNAGSSGNLTSDKRSGSTESFTEKITSSSTTPLEPDKVNQWKSVEVIAESKAKSRDYQQIDDEFDLFTKERVEKTMKPNSQQETALAIINVPKNNLGTLKEDEEKVDLNSLISETASSITAFYQNDSTLNEFNSKNSVKVYSDIITADSPQLNTTISRSDRDGITNNKKDIINPLMMVKNNNNSKENADINFDEIQRGPKGNEFIEAKKLPENKQFLRDRSASIGTITTKTPISQLTGEQNRTMLFQVGRSELRLISPDRKQILLHRAFKDVASCVLGRINKDHFGFVCRETDDTYACYVFQCESKAVAGEVINAIRQAFVAHADLLKRSKEKSPNMTCEHCPMLWYHRLCHDVEGMNDKRTHAFILRRLEQLPEDEQDLIVTKYQGGTTHMFETSDHNSFLMMLLRAHCEAKQQRHIHDTAENRSEFLNQYLGGSTIFMKARRSLSSGFDHLLKRKTSRDDGMAVQVKKETPPPPTGVEVCLESQEGELRSTDSIRSQASPTVANIDNHTPESNAPLEEKGTSEEKEDNGSVNSPMMDIFLKVSDTRASPTESGIEKDATWRQAIYEKVVNPTEIQSDAELISLRVKPSAPSGKRSKAQLRELWKMAINQTVLLVRMEKENARLKEREESSAVRRIKLEYTELGACDAGVTLMWDSLLSRGISQPMGKVDQHMLTQAVIQGVPRMSRGAIWYFLAEQACLRLPPPDTRDFPLFHTPYKSLLGGLTKHQHAILIDLGRTFPKHSYFSSALGPGQLALYNILKAYSLLDPDVGYCQGLSFVAGVLLLHMEEAEAFTLLRHLMFRRGLRRQYLPDMSALQVQLYQLSRLLRDHEPDLHAKLEAAEVSPALYAAPWMLTLFTSQFPLGLVVRVFDLIFLDSLDVVFSVSLALLSVHKDGLMMCESCEEIAEYLKHKLPDMNRSIYEKVMKKVHSLDISRQLSEYAVEYAVLREEMPRLATLTELNRTLQAENAKMSDELDSAMEAITNYQKSQARLEIANKNMEQQLMLLSRYISAHQRADMPGEIKKIVQNHIKKLSFSSKIFSTKSNVNEEAEDLRKTFKQGMSTPNLFAKITREEREQMKHSSPEPEKRFTMKKSQSVHSGLISRKQLKVLEERDENRRSDDTKVESLSESLKELGKKSSGFASTQEQILQERLFERQLKHDFDENLRKLDEKLKPKSYIDDLDIFQSRKSMSLNLSNETKVTKLGDSGFVTPMSPDARRDDASSTVSHPLSDCDVDIKFDGQSTKLKQIRPLKNSEKH